MAFNKINPINYNFHKINNFNTGKNKVDVSLVSILSTGFYFNKIATAAMKEKGDYYQVYFDSDNDVVLFAISNNREPGSSSISKINAKSSTLHSKNAMNEVTKYNPQLNLRNYSYMWELEEYSDDELAGFIFKPKSEPYSKKLRSKPMVF
ncbi:hypothetical protein AB0X56_04280 [Weissella paramesenteroides]|uniref:hypothetical protein n=1 Tax=Weissella paramesenteroides TaxID=1249 RepID=UPI003F27F086